METGGGEEAKAQELRESVNGALPKAVKQLELASSHLPADQDFHFYSNFKEFKSPVKEVRNRVVTALSQITSWKEFYPSSSSSTSSLSKPWPADSDDAYDKLVGVQDDLLEQVDAFMDKSKAEKKEQKTPELPFSRPPPSQVSTSSKDIRIARKGKNDSSARSPVPFHVRHIPRPQDKFDVAVDNTSTPFRHPSRLDSGLQDEPAGNDGSKDETDHVLGSIHPLKDDLSQMAFVEPLTEPIEARHPEALERTPYTFVDTLHSLKRMSDKLERVSEIAVDLENHHYRSYQGFVCLMQVSTREEDFLVDTLAVRSHLAACLGRIFADSKIRKVMHGADRDIVWLQRDFGIYVCNMFDTGQAARVLQLPSAGLAYLLEHFCGVIADKRYQLADWRIRPLPAEMVKYAREDTHYLLYIHDLLKQELIALRGLRESDGEDPWMEVCRRSRDICLQLYTKEPFTETSFINLHGLYERQFRPDQVAAVAKLYAWRDQVARREDESTGYVLPNHLLFQIATEMPEDVRQLQMIAKWPQTYVGRNAPVIINLLQEAKKNPWPTPLQPRSRPGFRDAKVQEEEVEEEKVVISSPVEIGAPVVFTAEDGEDMEGVEVDALKQLEGESASTIKEDVFADIARKPSPVVVSRKAGSMLFGSRISSSATNLSFSNSVSSVVSENPATSAACLGIDAPAATQPDADGKMARVAVLPLKEAAPADVGNGSPPTLRHQQSPRSDLNLNNTIAGLEGNETKFRVDPVSASGAEAREEVNGSSLNALSPSFQPKVQVVNRNVPEVKLKGNITGFGASLFGRSKKLAKVHARMEVQAVESSIALPFRTTVSGDQAVCSPSVIGTPRAAEFTENTAEATDFGNEESRGVQDQNDVLGDTVIFEEEGEGNPCMVAEGQEALEEKHRTWWPPSREEGVLAGPSGGSGASTGKKPEEERNSGTNGDQEDQSFPPSISDLHRTHKRRKRKKGVASGLSGGATGTPSSVEPTDQRKKSKVDETVSGKVISLDACALNGSFNYAEARKQLGLQNLYFEKVDEQHDRSQIGFGRGKSKKNASSSRKYQNLGFDALRKVKMDPKPEGIPNAPRRQNLNELEKTVLFSPEAQVSCRRCAFRIYRGSMQEVASLQLYTCHQESPLRISKMDVIRAALKTGLAAPGKVAITSGDTTVTYLDLLLSADRICALLNSRCESVGDVLEAHDGFPRRVRESLESKGDGPCVGIMTTPGSEFVAAVWGSWLKGCVVVPLSVSFPEAELIHIVVNADISLILVTEESSKIVEGLAAKTSAELLILSESARGNDGNSPQLSDNVRLNLENGVSTTSGDTAALIIYTSGTTGKPKGVVHTHSGLGAQVRLISEAWACNSEDRLLHCLPLHHVHGFINALMTPLYAGAAVDLLPKFSTSGVWHSWRKCYPLEGKASESPVSVFTGVPTMYVRLLQGYANMDPQLRKASAHAAKQLRLMLSASSALPEPVLDEWESVTGHRLVERYGMTEFGMGLSNPLQGEKKPGFVGKPLPGIQIRIDEAISDEAGVGELLFKSPSMFREYWRQPQATKDSFTEDGYFRTGDMVRIDEDGYVKILGRTSVDILMVGGFKVSALEIEAVMLQHPVIAECAIFGIPDHDYGEVPCAVIVPSVADPATETQSLSLKELQSWASERLTPYKIPKELITLQTMPRNSMGKVNKKELKKTLTCIS
ncbi:hypothetical protein R1sor_001462 [Riccia sorocarpa]|uniref:HRDC domain-containing protein n=1 Tax=Riccia sorocarpa TaxID=122646 RepID=A0ABD3GZB3_9MARC